MRKPHPHADIIKAWADGVQIQYYALNEWHDLTGEQPCWFRDSQFRIKPEPKSDQVVYPATASYRGENGYARTVSTRDRLKLTFDGETGELKKAEVLDV